MNVLGRIGVTVGLVAFFLLIGLLLWSTFSEVDHPRLEKVIDRGLMLFAVCVIGFVMIYFWIVVSMVWS